MSHPVQFVQVERADYGEIDRLTVPPGNPRPKHRKKKIGSTPTPTPTLTRNHFLSLTNECVLVGKGSSNGGFSAASHPFRSPRIHSGVEFVAVLGGG